MLQECPSIRTCMAPSVDTEPSHSMAWLIDQVLSDETLKETRRRNVASSIRRFCQVLGLDPTQAPADFAYFREHLQGFHPTQARIKARRWSTIKSDVSFALKRYTRVPEPKRPRRPFSKEWETIKDAAKSNGTPWGLHRFARFCDERGIAPRDVDEQVFQAFCDHLRSGTFKTKPERQHREACRLWNRLAETCADLRLQSVSLPSYRETYAVNWEELPESFRKEADDWLTLMSREADLLDEDAPDRPHSESSIITYRFALRQTVGGLVARGWDINAFTSLNTLIEPETAKEALRFFVERYKGKAGPNTATVSHVLVLIAQKAVHADQQTVERLRKLRKRMSVRSPGMSSRPKEALRQFLDPDNIARLLLLPERIYRRLKRKEVLDLADARLMRSAIALELQFMRPLRRKNLVSLQLDRHILRVGQRMLVAIPAEEVKNNVELDYPLPKESADLLNFYIQHLLPLFPDNPDGFLFPGTIPGKPLSAAQLGRQLRQTIRQETGLYFFPHLARHFCAYLYLQHNPEGIDTVRRVLAHTDPRTTLRSYASFKDDAAVRQYDALFLQIRERVARQLSDD